MVFAVVDFVRFALAFVRLATFFAVAPLFNMGNIPLAAKFGLGAFTALIIMPPFPVSLNPESLPVLALLALEEVAIGLLLALVVTLVFAIVTFAGHFVDTPLGFGMASVFDPALGGQVPVFSRFYHILAALIFFGLDAHLWLIQALQYSFQVIPYGGVLEFEPVFWLVMSLVQQLFLLGLQIALPVIATILLTDIGLGIVIRAVPQINVFVLGFPIKIVVGLIVVVFALPAFIVVATRMFAVDGLLFRYLQALLAGGGG